MAKKTIKAQKPEEIEVASDVVETEVAPVFPIGLLSVDYHREDLNNMARKINEIIMHLHGKA